MTSADRTRLRLIDTARSVLGDRPTATADDIAEAASLSRATFYRHFRSRSQLLAELDLEPDRGTRERVLEQAADLIGRDGLAGLSMDELAAAAGVSRASVYRLFPGKAALFGAVVDAFSPYQPIIARLAELGDAAPEVVLPELYRLGAAATEGRIGILRAMFLEITAGSPEALEGAGRMISDLLAALGGYLQRQMDAGRIRRMHPTLAAQVFIGPMLFHRFTRPAARQFGGLDMPIGDVAAEMARTLLDGLVIPAAAPHPGEGSPRRSR